MLWEGKSPFRKVTLFRIYNSGFIYVGFSLRVLKEKFQITRVCFYSEIGNHASHYAPPYPSAIPEDYEYKSILGALPISQVLLG